MSDPLSPAVSAETCCDSCGGVWRANRLQTERSGKMCSLASPMFRVPMVCLGAWLALVTVVAGESPNIVVILADDMGYGDVGAYNPESKIATPHLDRLASAGMRFTDAHSGGSTCVPSRYALLTGRFAVRANLRSRAGPTIEEDRVTIASLLRDNGYVTAMVGKWHEGFEMVGGKFDYQNPLRGGPVDRGFDSFFGMHASLDIPAYFYIRDREPTSAPDQTIDAGTSVGGPEGWNRIQAPSGGKDRSVRTS